MVKSMRPPQPLLCVTLPPSLQSGIDISETYAQRPGLSLAIASVPNFIKQEIVPDYCPEGNESILLMLLGHRQNAK